jgi:transposase
MAVLENGNVLAVAAQTKGGDQMLYAGLDLGGQESYLHVLTGKGQRVTSCRLATSKAALSGAFGPWLAEGIKVALEAGGSSRWVHDYLMSLGVEEVHVVNPQRMRLIAQSRKKTDKVDARILAELYRLDGLPEKVHMPSLEAARARMLNQGRTTLVKLRTQINNTIRGFLRSLGVRLPARHLNRTQNWEELLGLPEVDETACLLLEAFKPVAEGLTKALKNLEGEISQRHQSDPRVSLLQTVPGVGPQSAAVLVAAVDDIKRFKSGKQLASYSGLAPTVRNSGDREVTGHITRQGRSEIRRVFVQAAHRLVTLKSLEARPLQRWFDRVKNRRGYKTAIVALARRLVTLAYVLLRDMAPYDPRRLQIKP